jgi:hypothetical protein
MSFIRHVLTGAGTLFAGTGMAGWFSDGNINLAVMVIGFLVSAAATWWGNQSNKPVALAQKLVDNPEISNAQAAKAIAAGEPEKVEGPKPDPLDAPYVPPKGKKP